MSTAHRQGNLRADKILYKDGIGCCVWYPFPDEKSDDMGLCFDFSYDDLDDFIALLQKLKAVMPDVFVDDTELPNSMLATQMGND